MAALFLGLVAICGSTDCPADAGRNQGEAASERWASITPDGDGKGSNPDAPVADPGAKGGDGLPPGLVGLLQQIPRAGPHGQSEARDQFVETFRGPELHGPGR